MIIKCPECGKEISDKAKFCIHCGFTLNEAASSVNKNPSDAPETKIEYKELHSNGRIFHYIDDSSKPLCPHCIERCAKLKDLAHSKLLTPFQVMSVRFPAS